MCFSMEILVFKQILAIFAKTMSWKKKKNPIINLYKISLCFHYWQSIHIWMMNEIIITSLHMLHLQPIHTKTIYTSHWLSSSYILNNVQIMATPN
jgi:hypothetical protein